MTFAQTLIQRFRRPQPDTDDAFGNRLSQMGRNHAAILPRFHIFKNLASRRAA